MAAEQQQPHDKHTMCQKVKLQSALAAFMECHPQTDTQDEALKVIGKILVNIKRNPLEPKFRRLRCTNDRLQRCLTGLEKGTGVLEAIGFSLQGEYWCLRPDSGSQQPPTDHHQSPREKRLQSADDDAQPSASEERTPAAADDHEQSRATITSLQHYVEAQLHIFDRYVERLEADRYRLERDTRIRLAREREKACPDHFRKSVCRRHEQDEVRAQLLAKIEADKREREADGRIGLPRAFEGGDDDAKGTNTRSSSPSSSSLGGGGDAKPPSGKKQKIYIHNGVLEPVLDDAAPAATTNLPPTDAMEAAVGPAVTSVIESAIASAVSLRPLGGAVLLSDNTPFAAQASSIMQSPRKHSASHSVDGIAMGRGTSPKNANSARSGDPVAPPYSLADAFSSKSPAATEAMINARRRVSTFATPTTSTRVNLLGGGLDFQQNNAAAAANMPPGPPTLRSSAFTTTTTPPPLLRQPLGESTTTVVRRKSQHPSTAGRGVLASPVYTATSYHREFQQQQQRSGAATTTAARLPLGDYASLLDFDRSRLPQRPAASATAASLSATYSGGAASIPASRMPSYSPLTASPAQRRYSTQGYYRPPHHTTYVPAAAAATIGIITPVTPPPSTRSTIGSRTTPPAAGLPLAASRFATAFVGGTSGVPAAAAAGSPYFQRNPVADFHHQPPAHRNGSWTARDNTNQPFKVSSAGAGSTLPSVSEKQPHHHAFSLLQPQRWHHQQQTFLVGGSLQQQPLPSRTVSWYSTGNANPQPTQRTASTAAPPTLLPMHEETTQQHKQQVLPRQYFVERPPSTRKTSAFTTLGY